MGCATLCERTVGCAEACWEPGCGLRSGGGASDDGAEEGGGGNCCRSSGLEGKAMLGAEKPIELRLSLTLTAWFSAE